VKVVKKLVQKEEIQFLCLQETKKEVVDKRLCSLIWGDSSMDWIALLLAGFAGGLLSMCDTNCFQLRNNL